MNNSQPYSSPAKTNRRVKALVNEMQGGSLHPTLQPESDVQVGAEEDETIICVSNFNKLELSTIG